MPARVPDTQNGHLNGIAEDVVITGISGRLPESDNIEEFKQQLFDGVDLVTDDERRWPSGLYSLPARTGKLKDLSRFDATFFGVHAKQAHVMDPQLRMLLELTFEAIVMQDSTLMKYGDPGLGCLLEFPIANLQNFGHEIPNKSTVMA
jgi:fatty acid synthase